MGIQWDRANAEQWFANGSAGLRDWLIARTPELLHELIANAPLWVLAAMTVVTGLAAVWSVVQLFESAWKGLQALLNPVKAVKETFNPEPAATKRDVEGLKRQVAAQTEQLERIKALLDQGAAFNVAAGAKPLDADARQRRDIAAAEIVAEGRPAATEAARELAAGDLAGAIATLERDARADTEMAAEKWRRIGALVLGVDTAKARAAYEEAFRLQPEDFWTCVELARLRQESGDLNGARESALACERAAQDDRERGVAANTLGDVLREGGDLAGARARYEQYLEISERLAQGNPGSAEAQRDLSFSYARLGDVLREGGDLAGARARYEQSLEIRERLAQGNPGSAQAQSDLSVSYNSLGDVLREGGDLAGARARYEQSLEIRERLARDNPGSAQAQSDLAVSHARMGEVGRLAGDKQKALSHYRRAREIIANLLAINPDSIGNAVCRIEYDYRLAQINEDNSAFVQLRQELSGLRDAGKDFKQQNWMRELENKI